MFWIIIFILIVFAVSFIVIPLRLYAADKDYVGQLEEVDPMQANVQIYNERMEQLQEELEEKTISKVEFDTLMLELQKTLLSDVSDKDDVYKKREGNQPEPNRSVFAFRQTLAFVVLIPLVAISLYWLLGSYPELQQAEDFSESQVWYEKAIQLQEQEKYSDALEAMQIANDLFPNTPDYMVELAQLKYIENKNKMTAEILLLLNKSLELSPADPMAITMLGLYAMEQQEFRKAISLWQEAMGYLPEQSPFAVSLHRMILDTKRQTGGYANDEYHSVKVYVRIANNIKQQVSSDTPVFVFAKPIGTSRSMPLAATKLVVGELPAEVRLSELDAMIPSRSLGNVDKVVITARISMNGDAIPSAGDFQGISAEVELAEHAVSIELVIDQKI